MTREQKGGVAIGGIIGLLVWLFDSRYIVLGGPENTPVSDFIHSILPIDAVCKTGLEGFGDICDYFSTLIVLTFVGIVIGYTVASIKRSIFKPPPHRP